MSGKIARLRMRTCLRARIRMGKSRRKFAGRSIPGYFLRDPTALPIRFPSTRAIYFYIRTRTRMINSVSKNTAASFRETPTGRKEKPGGTDTLGGIAYLRVIKQKEQWKATWKNLTN